MRVILILAALATALTACQSTRDSMYSAERVCLSAGLKPGSKAFDKCANAAYTENRRQSDQATTAVTMGAAAGVLGGVLVGAAASKSRTNNHYYYGPPRGRYYYSPRCNRRGCW